MTYRIEGLGQEDFEQAPKKRRKVDKKKIFYYSLIALPLIQFCIFYIGVNFQSILLAFQDYKGGKFEFLGGNLFANFKEVFNDIVKTKTILIAAKNSLIVWFFTAICGTALAIFFSYYVYKRKTIGRFYRFILFLPSIIPAIVITIIFNLFTESIMPIAFGVGGWLQGTDKSAMFITVVIYNLWVGFGTQVLLYSNAMEQINPSIIEAGQLDGAKPMREFISIVLPEVIGTVLTFMIASIATLFINQANLFNFYGPYDGAHPLTLGYYMFTLVQINNSGYGYDWFPYASALGLCCTLIAIPLTVLFRKLCARFED